MCAFLLIKLHFGYYMSKDKCFLKPVRQLQVLGLILDTARHSWMVPPSKSAHCCARLSAVITSLRAAPAQPARLDFCVMASLAGTAMSRCCPHCPDYGFPTTYNIDFSLARP